VVVTLDAKVRKVVPVRADLVGTPPVGFRVASVQVDPAQVELEGARSEVRRIREVLTDRVDVSELRQSLEQDVRLLLGAGNVWRSEAGERVRVRVEIAGPTEGASGAAPGPRSGAAPTAAGRAG
jgi:YbbR domain-containing protein